MKKLTKPMPYKDLIEEHEGLVDTLQSPSKEDDKQLLKEQKKELKEYKQEYKNATRIGKMKVGDHLVMGPKNIQAKIGMDKIILEAFRKVSSKPLHIKGSGKHEIVIKVFLNGIVVGPRRLSKSNGKTNYRWVLKKSGDKYVSEFKKIKYRTKPTENNAENLAKELKDAFQIVEDLIK